MVVLAPSGDVAMRQRDLLVHSTLLMLVIIVPVMALTVWFAWHYRASNHKARYEPDWHHSTRLELVIWAAPLLIIICLGALTWLGTHLLDPYRPLDRLGANRPTPPHTASLRVDVVALDWKWLFIYPDSHIATVNELVVPIDTPVDLHITASSVMNSLYVPELAGQVYAMPGMETRLHGVLNKVGVSHGFSGNYSGAGFSGMRFLFRGVTRADFDKWVADVGKGTRSSDGADSRAGAAPNGAQQLTRAAYTALAKPSENEPVRHFSSPDPTLFHAIVNRCLAEGAMCMDPMHAMAHE
ncbi:MAG TPA: ubiquinol oxidase subunit II [Steroidobacteraceae bacterium]